MEYLLIFISAIFVNNIVLSQFLGICPFLGVSKKISTSLGMGAAVTFVLTLSTIVTYLVQVYVLNPFGLQYLQTLAFILVIAALVQMVEIILKKVSPALYQALGIFLPLITTNCAVLGVAILVIQRDYNLLESVVYAFSTALGFAVALVTFAVSVNSWRSSISLRVCAECLSSLSRHHCWHWPSWVSADYRQDWARSSG